MIDVKTFVTALCFAVTAFAVQAAPTTYFCKLDSGKARGWVAPEMIIQYDAASGAAKVLDGIIGGAYGKPIPAQLALKGKQVVLGWTVLVEDRLGQDTNMRYIGRHVPGSNRLSITAQPDGSFEGRFRATGRCQATERRYEGF